MPWLIATHYSISWIAGSSQPSIQCSHSLAAQAASVAHTRKHRLHYSTPMADPFTLSKEKMAVMNGDRFFRRLGRRLAFGKESRLLQPSFTRSPSYSWCPSPSFIILQHLKILCLTRPAPSEIAKILPAFSDTWIYRSFSHNKIASLSRSAIVPAPFETVSIFPPAPLERYQPLKLTAVLDSRNNLPQNSQLSEICYY